MSPDTKLTLLDVRVLFQTLKQKARYIGARAVQGHTCGLCNEGFAAERLIYETKTGAFVHVVCLVRWKGWL